MQITKRSKDAPYAYKLIYQDPATASTQPSTTTSGDDPPEPASTISDEGYGVPNGVRGALRASTPPASASSAPTTSARPNPSDPPDLDRHARRCCICSHPDRDAIEGEFVRWRSPRNIAKNFQLSDRASFYRHAHATGLFARRRREFARVLEDILECVEDSSLAETADVIIRAARVYARLDENGNWVEPPRTHIILTGPAPTQFTGNPELEVSAEPQLRPHDIPFKLANRLINQKKAKKKLIATHHNSKNGPTQ